MSIYISEEALGEILKIKKENNILYDYLRIGIKSDKNCGFIQFYEFEKIPCDQDRVFEFDNIKVCIDQKSYLFLNGMRIECKNGILLKFNLPKIAHSCGCEDSFIFEDICL